jgi:hypothetical protein
VRATTAPSISAFVIRKFRFQILAVHAGRHAGALSRMQGCQDREAHVGTASTARLATASAMIRVLLASCAIGATASADHVAMPHTDFIGVLASATQLIHDIVKVDHS